MLTPYVGKIFTWLFLSEDFKGFSPSVAPWKFEVIETRRVNGFRGVNARIKLTVFA